MTAATHYQLPRGYQLNSRFGAVYEDAPSTADDLSIIRGIETREAVGLNRLGIYYLAQIAMWSDRQAASIAEELGMSESAIFRDRWVQQAGALCEAAQNPMPSAAATAPPASGSRTITVMVCSLLVGCLIVSWLNRQAQLPMNGILTAEVTTLRVPADSRLLTTRVKPGDEVFSGQTLLTLEKTEHLELIAEQARRVQSLAEEVSKAEAQVSLQLRWRLQELDQQLTDVHNRSRFIDALRTSVKDAEQEADSARKTAAAAIQKQQEEAPQPRIFHTASSPRHTPATRRPGPINGLLFISKSGGTLALPEPEELVPLPPEAKQQRVEIAALAPPGRRRDTGPLFQLETRSLEERLQRLEDLKTQLPAQVRLATGLESLRSELREARQRLDQLQSLSRETAVLCPAYGKVGQVRYREGDRMTRGESMIQVLHTDRRYVMVQAPVSRAADLQPGTQLVLRFPDHDDREGIVADIPVLTDRQMTQGQSLASVRVDTIGRQWPNVDVGSTVEVLVK